MIYRTSERSIQACQYGGFDEIPDWLQGLAVLTDYNAQVRQGDVRAHVHKLLDDALDHMTYSGTPE